MGTYLLITPREDELYHFGIKGMKWGIRRFQPYQKGEKVKGGKEVGAATKVKQRPSSGNIIERYKAHKVKQKRVAALKKAQATRKANADFEAEKKKAIESGSIEDLAKFKGKLTNEEYNRAFMRLQNEKKVADMVAANQKTVWDKIDKGMAIVQKVGGYANTLATAKENFTKLDDALHKKEKEDAKEKATAEKNKFITNIENITELNRGMDKYKLTPQEYQSAMNILRNKKLARGKDNDIDEDFVDQDRKAAKEKAAKDQADRDKWTAEQNWKQYQNRQEKEAKKAWKEYQKKAKKAADEPKDGEWWEDKPNSNSGKTESSKSPEQRTDQLLLTTKDVKPSSASNDNSNPKRAYEKTPKTVREKAAYVNPDGESSKRTISGYKKSDKPASYSTAYLVEEQSLGVVARVLKAKKESAPSKTAVDAGKKVADEYVTRMANVRATYDIGNSSASSSSSKRSISGAKTGNSSSYKQQANLNFGGSNVSRYSAKPSTPSKVVTDTRQTVANTQAEAARQREIDKKRRAKMK